MRVREHGLDRRVLCWSNVRGGRPRRGAGAPAPFVSLRLSSQSRSSSSGSSRVPPILRPFPQGRRLQRRDLDGSVVATCARAPWTRHPRHQESSGPGFTSWAAWSGAPPHNPIYRSAGWPTPTPPPRLSLNEFNYPRRLLEPWRARRRNPSNRSRACRTGRPWAACEGVLVAGWHGSLGDSGGAALEDRCGLFAAMEAVHTEGARLLVAPRRDRLARDLPTSVLVERLRPREARLVQGSWACSSRPAPRSCQ